MEKYLYINRLYLVEESTQSIKKNCIKFDAWNKIENCTVLEEKN